MSLQPQKLPEIPEETARIAKILFPKSNVYMWLRDELGAIYNDEQFAALYPNSGQLAEQPWRLAIASVIQYMENYTDRQVAEAVKTRIDLKYALSLELTDLGFDFSVLSEFRSRLIKGGLEGGLLISPRGSGLLDSNRATTARGAAHAPAGPTCKNSSGNSGTECSHRRASGGSELCW